MIHSTTAGDGPACAHSARLWCEVPQQHPSTLWTGVAVSHRGGDDTYMAHTPHPAPIHPDTRGDISWRSLTEQLGFHSVSDLCTFLDLTSDEAPADQRDVVPVDLEDAARLSVDIARAFIEAREL